MAQHMNQVLADLLERASILTDEELAVLGEGLAKLRSDRQHERKAQAIAQIRAIAEGVGMSPVDLMKMAAPRKPIGKVAAKYQHPTNSNLIWTGRGRAPSWAQELKDQGLLEKARIQPTQ